MEARNRDLPDWFTRVRTGQVRLPRFQRFEAWSHEQVADLLETVLRGLPAGAALVLEIGDKEPFHSRTVVGAPAPAERANEHLLDGQQRLTALWRSFNDGYPDRSFFVRIDDGETADGASQQRIVSQSRWYRGGDKRRYPLWCDKAQEAYQRSLVPLQLLRPGDIAKETTAWCREAAGNDPEKVLDLNNRITALREKVTAFKLPFLSLPVGTARDVALDVFIKMNTSASPLTAFDIVVAQLEEAMGQSLHELISGLRSQVDGLEAYGDPRDIILAVAAMREGRSPTQATFLSLDLNKLSADWEQIVKGIGFAIEFLGEEKIFDSERLPTSAVIPVLAVAHDLVPGALDARGNAKSILRKYLWRAFLTGRYEGAAATRSLADLRGVQAVLRMDPTAVVPLFDERDYPAPISEQLVRAGWPKARDILARGILAISLRGGAQDLADETPVSRAHLRVREYHHLFPDALLAGDGGLANGESYCALNCALITWNTNRTISAKEPIQYLRERVERALLGESEIRTRLATHAVPFDALNVGGYAEIKDPTARSERIRADFKRFLEARAETMLRAVAQLWQGRPWP